MSLPASGLGAEHPAREHHWSDDIVELLVFSRPYWHTIATGTCNYGTFTKIDTGTGTATQLGTTGTWHGHESTGFCTAIGTGTLARAPLAPNWHWHWHYDGTDGTAFTKNGKLRGPPARVPGVKFPASSPSQRATKGSASHSAAATPHPPNPHGARVSQILLLAPASSATTVGCVLCSHAWLAIYDRLAIATGHPKGVRVTPGASASKLAECTRGRAAELGAMRRMVSSSSGLLSRRRCGVSYDSEQRWESVVLATHQPIHRSTSLTNRPVDRTANRPTESPP
ncbi:hypothetical protein V8E53_000563 [Lactarius tabidus]